MAGQAEKFIKGMNKDTARIDQIDGTYRDALNAVIDSDKGAITSEHGNSTVASLVDPANVRSYDVVGQIALPNDDFLMFGAVIELGISYSGIFYIDVSAQTSRMLYTTNQNSVDGDLAFDVEHPVTGEFRVSPTGEIITYFTDNKYTETTEPNTGIKYISQYNPPRVFNVTRQIEYLDAGGVAQNLYSVTSANVSILNLFMDSGRIPEFKSVEILQGGGVESGTYYLGIAYADKDFTETNVLTLSNPVYVVPSPEDTIPREIISGSPNEFQTNKSLKWTINRVNTDYKYAVPYILQRIGNAEFVYKLEPVEINTSAVGNLLPNEVEITYSGLENSAQSSIEEAVIDKVKFLTAKSLTQLDNKLYAANLTARKDLGFQRFANGIQLKAVVESITSFDPRRYDIFNLNDGYTRLVRADTAAAAEIYPYINSVIRPLQENTSKGYRDVEELLFKKKTYRRGEVYSFYISFILKDGGESFAYHIPGRNFKAVSSTGTEVSLLSTNPIVGFNGGEISGANPNSKVYQYLDTSYIGTSATTTGYWENENEYYPNTDDFDVWATDNSGTPVQTGSLRGLNVRHHKMPSNHNTTFSYIKQDTDFSNPGLLAGDDTYGTAEFKEEVRILGVKLEGIHIPRFILEQVQGYKIYYAKRTQGNKTIIGQSGLHGANAINAANLSITREDAKSGPFFNLWFLTGDHQTSGTIQKEADWTSSTYLSQSVVKFHDFNLLRKKHTLATATHVDIQYIVTMQNWEGRYKGAQKVTPADTSQDVYTSFRAGHGDDEYAWVHPDLGNTINFEYNPDDTNYDILGPSSMFGYVFVGAKYWSLGNSGTDVGVDSWTSLAGQLDVLKQDQLLSPLQAIFTIAPESATYVSGLSFLKNISSTAFKGASYLVNNSGESSIALGFDSGVPALTGFYSNKWKSYDHASLLKCPIGSPPAPFGANQGGRPNVYLANLCSAKTDVFEPFDQQQLVWTGFYQSLLGLDIDNPQIEFNGKLYSYYTGAVSTNIFGGDTYICRYAYRTTAQSHAITYFKVGDNAQQDEDPNNTIGTIYGDIPFDMYTGTTGSFNVLGGGNQNQREDTIGNSDNWIRGSVSPITTLYQFIVESDDNINFRHCGDVQAGVSPAASVYFDKFTAADVLYKSPLYDLTKMDNLLYEDQYSALQDKRVTVPFPKKERSTNLYPNRIIRSNTQDGNFNDAYRAFIALQYKDFGQNKGAITNIFNLDALIYIHTERSLFRTKGKQTMELGDTSQAYIGSGDLFAQEPDEFVQSSEGHLGSYNKLGSLVTKDGYIFVSRKTRKIFLIADKVVDLSNLGLGTWSRDFIPFAVENYGLNLDAMNINQDAPTGRFGFLVSYDPLFKRSIITKRELVPTEFFQSQFASGAIYYDSRNNYFLERATKIIIPLVEGLYFQKGGWTISFSHDFTVWASRHSYIPPMYAFNSKYLYSFSPSNPAFLFEHHDYDNPGNFYRSLYNFEFEFIYTGETTTTTTGAVSSTKAVNKIFTSISYVADVFRKEATSLRQFDNKFDTGFTSFYVYNTMQNSGETDFSYLSNIRKTDNTWVTNAFRDLSAISFNTNMVQGQINVHGDLYTGTYTTSNTETMFLSEGVLNPNYLDLNKPWYEQRKFVDKFLGIRLISNNQAKNLINLYTAKAAYRTSNR
jgi:hypothetical protein